MSTAALVKKVRTLRKEYGKGCVLLLFISLFRERCMTMLHALWNDEVGFIISSELVLIATILVIGMIVGLTTIRDQVVQEMGDIAMAFSDLTQSYSFGGVSGHTSSTAGSNFVDQTDFCDVAPSQTADGNNSPACINVNVDPSEEGA